MTAKLKPLMLTTVELSIIHIGHVVPAITHLSKKKNDRPDMQSKNVNIVRSVALCRHESFRRGRQVTVRCTQNTAEMPTPSNPGSPKSQ